MHLIQPCVFPLLLLSFSLLSSLHYSNGVAPFPDEELSPKFSRKLSEPLIGDNGRVLACSGNHLYAFESNASVAWALRLNVSCNIRTAPIHGGRGRVYLVGRSRVHEVKFSEDGSHEPSAKVFFEDEGQEIIGVSASTSGSMVFINVKNRGLFAYSTSGQLQWSTGPVLYQSGYRQGCRKNTTDCFFSSAPMIDKCEASVYISNSEGEAYSISMRSSHFKWILDLNSFGNSFILTPGNNGLLYVTVPIKAIVLAIDVASGAISWQARIGPLGETYQGPVVDSNGWISIGSLDGFLYSFSPTGMLKKFSKSSAMDSVIQVSPVLDCSGYSLYVSQTEMEEKMSREIDQFTYVSAKRPKGLIFTLLAPSSGSVYWSESYPGKFMDVLLQTDLNSHFVVDERIILALLAASKTGNQLPCRSRRQTIASSCSLAKIKPVDVDAGNEKAIVLFLLFESAVLILLLAIVRFCCIFWKKKKLQNQNLGNFLDKRRNFQLKKKELDRTISDLKQKAGKESADVEMDKNLSDLSQKREGIEKKLSTTYSLGRDSKARSYSLRSRERESLPIFNTRSNSLSPSSGSDSEGEMSREGEEFSDEMKATTRREGFSDCENFDFEGEAWQWRNPLEAGSSSGGARVFSFGEEDRRKLRIKRRRALSSSN